MQHIDIKIFSEHTNVYCLPNALVNNSYYKWLFSSPYSMPHISVSEEEKIHKNGRKWNKKASTEKTQIEIVP